MSEYQSAHCVVEKETALELKGNKYCQWCNFTESAQFILKKVVFLLIESFIGRHLEKDE